MAFLWLFRASRRVADIEGFIDEDGVWASRSIPGLLP